MNHQVLRDATLFVVRLVLGISAIAHGFQSCFQRGMSGPMGTVEIFRAANVPAPQVIAYLTTVVEMLGGALLITGLLATAAAGALAIVAALKFYFFHLPYGFFAADNGVELPLLVFVCCLTIVVFGAGRASLDRAFTRFV